MSTTAQEKYARLNCRVSLSIKNRVEEAAQTLGLSITDFTETAVAEKAEAVLAQAGRIELSEAEFDRFLAAIENPPAPTAKLRDAAEAYKKLRESDPNW
jgi:uncharacterized protein (DUF1778 family)